MKTGEEGEDSGEDRGDDSWEDNGEDSGEEKVEKVEMVDWELGETSSKPEWEEEEPET